jgi:tetratricopeptide (TPR) repeat protein
MIDKHTKHLLAGAKRGFELMDERNPAEALKVFREVLIEARKAGIESANLLWGVAVASDYTGELEMAFENVTAALALDPLAGPIHHSFEVITRRIREALAAPDRATDDPSTPRLYAILVRAGEAEVESHAAMARYHLATGNVPAATAIADAAALLYPASKVAWEAKAAVANARGDAEGAELARIEGVAAGAASTPFTAPGGARA